MVAPVILPPACVNQPPPATRSPAPRGWQQDCQRYGSHCKVMIPMTRLLCLTVTVWCCSLFAQAPNAKDKAVFDGVVRDSITKQPIAKASIRLTPAAQNQPAYAGTSDASGAFRFEAVIPDDYTIEVQHRGYTSAKVAAIGTRQASARLHFVAGQAIAAATVWLEPEAVVTGHVTDSDGEPAPDAKVVAVAEQWERGLRVYRQAGYAETADCGGHPLIG